MVMFSKTLYKLVSIFLGNKKKKNINAADPEILSYMGQFFNKEGQTRLKLVLQPNFVHKIGW